MLKQLGFEVAEAVHGQDALDQLAAGLAPDVVLVDWNMPVLNGLDFVRAVRAQPHYQELPLMMVASETEVEQMSLAQAAGANEYVMKPFGKEVIADKLQMLGF